jgi:hypothetical protein
MSVRVSRRPRLPGHRRGGISTHGRAASGTPSRWTLAGAGRASRRSSRRGPRFEPNGPAPPSGFGRVQIPPLPEPNEQRTLRVGPGRDLDFRDARAGQRRIVPPVVGPGLLGQDGWVRQRQVADPTRRHRCSATTCAARRCQLRRVVATPRRSGRDRWARPASEQQRVCADVYDCWTVVGERRGERIVQLVEVVDPDPEGAAGTRELREVGVDESGLPHGPLAGALLLGAVRVRRCRAGCAGSAWRT